MIQDESPTRLPVSPAASKPDVGTIYGDDGYLQAILDMAVEGIIVIDERGVITTFNRAAVRIFGYPQGEVLGRNVSCLMPAPVAGRHQTSIDRYLRTGQAMIIGIGREVVGQRKDGSTFPMELAVSEVRQNGRRTFTGIVRDISRRRALERAILEASEREQRRIGKALHDGLCQELAGIALLVKSLQHASAESKRSACGEVSRYLRSAVRHARLLARSLQPVEPLSSGLVAALKALASDTREETGRSCVFRCRHAIEVDDKTIAINLYRVAQECIRNAMGCTRECEFALSLLAREGGLTLTIRINIGGKDDVVNVQRALIDDMIHHRMRVIGGDIAVIREKPSTAIVTCNVSVTEAVRDNEE